MEVRRVRVRGLIEPRSDPWKLHGLARSLVGVRLKLARVRQICFTAWALVDVSTFPFPSARIPGNLTAPASSPANLGSTYVCGTARALI